MSKGEVPPYCHDASHFGETPDEIDGYFRMPCVCKEPPDVAVAEGFEVGLVGALAIFVVFMAIGLLWDHMALGVAGMRRLVRSWVRHGSERKAGTEAGVGEVRGECRGGAEEVWQEGPEHRMEVELPEGWNSKQGKKIRGQAQRWMELTGGTGSG